MLKLNPIDYSTIKSATHFSAESLFLYSMKRRYNDKQIEEYDYYDALIGDKQQGTVHITRKRTPRVS